MKTLNRSVIVAGVALATLLGASQLAAQQQGQGGQGGQGRGNFDPERMRQMMMDNVREQFGIKSDDEWKVIEPRVQKVMDARRDVGFGGGMGMFRPGGRRRGGAGGDANNQADNNNRRPRFGGEPSPEAQDLQKAIDANASKDVIEAKLAKFRESRKKKQAQLEQTQEELRKVLTVKQEASAVLMGLLQ
jgi:hypothetical protein